MGGSSSRHSVISLFEEYHEIKIPIIQRDYAQGRRSAKEIRKNFLNSIKDNLNKNFHLDFIYGSVKKSEEGKRILILLDGQQRITTLFLLYWYSAVREERIDEFQNKFCLKMEDRIKSKLRYEVRANSGEFLDNIVSDVTIKFKNEVKPSEVIKDKNWFYLKWLYNPTILGMLNVIDDIHKTFKDKEELFSLLYDEEKITFDFLPLDKFGLTDDLYIKMNSRGKLLTPYENFKAKFERLIESNYSKEEFIKIAQKFERDYVDLFWKYAKQNGRREKENVAKLTDEYMYWFFYNLTFNLYTVNSGNKLRNAYSKIDDFVQENSLVSFFAEVYKSRNEIDNVIKFLDHLCSDNKDILEQVANILRESPTLWDRARFYAYYLGIVEHKKDRDWYRVLKNLINNTRIDSLEEYINALKAIKKLSYSLNGQKILDYIKTKKESQKIIDFFHQSQQIEEVLKAELISKDTRWKEEIIVAEKHWYLDGKIRFLIEFSEYDGSYDLEKFKEYRDKFMKLWDFAKGNKDNQNLLYRALLSKGDYLPKVGQNRTFCSFDTGIRAKSENWHKVFESDKKECLKNLLDDLNSSDSITTELESIIRKSTVVDWRKYFIENPNYINYCEKLQLRFCFINNEIGKIYLLKRKQLNGRHVELHSWHLFNKCFGLKPESDRVIWWKLEAKKVCEPFSYAEYVESTSHEEPYILLKCFKGKTESREHDLGLKITYEYDKFRFEIIDESDKKVDGYEIVNMFQEEKYCCEWLIEQATNLIKQIIKKSNGQS